MRRDLRCFIHRLSLFAFRIGANGSKTSTGNSSDAASSPPRSTPLLDAKLQQVLELNHCII
jgi:hypothetical protein